VVGSRAHAVLVRQGVLRGDRRSLLGVKAGGQVVGRLGIEPRRVTQKSVQCDYFAVPDPGAVPKGALKPFDSVTVAVP